MQLGFVSAIFGDLSLEEVFQHASDLGYDCVEVMCWPPGGPDRKYGGVCHLDCTDFSQAQADDTNALAEKFGVAISALGYYSIPLSAEKDQADASREHLRKVIDATAMLGLPTTNSFIGANKHMNLGENFQQYEQVWPDIVKYAEDKGVRIGIENCPMLFENTWPFGLNMARTPAIWRRMFEIIPSESFGLNYDPSHLRMQLIDPIAPIREFGPRIFHTHAKDMRVDTHSLNEIGSLEPPMSRSTAKIPGYGDINWGAFLGALTDAGYDGPVCVEVEDEAFEGDVARRRQSLQVSHGVLRPLIA